MAPLLLMALFRTLTWAAELEELELELASTLTDGVEAGGAVGLGWTGAADELALVGTAGGGAWLGASGVDEGAGS